MVLRRRLLEHRARRDVVLLAAVAVGEHQAELVLRLGVGLGRPAEQSARLRGIGRRSTAGAAERGKIADTARIAGLRRPLEQLSCLCFVFCNTGAGAVGNAELDHRRARSLVGRLAPGGDRLRRLPVGGIGAAEREHRPPRRRCGLLAEFDGGRNVGGSKLRHALHIGRLVGIAGIGGHPVAQDEIGRLGMRR